MKSLLKIGTRGSQLALYQAELTKTHLLGQFPMIEIEIVVIKTSGDMIRRGVHSPFETKRIFTREIEDALIAGQIDLAVHSAKDMAVDMPPGLHIPSVLEREDPRDCLISREKHNIAQLPLGARIGTSSIRRKVQLLRWNDDLIIEDVRGNVDTRLRKMEEGSYDAIVLAAAGVKRLGLSQWIAEYFPPDRFFPSPCQGIIAIQSRQNDPEVEEMVRVINHPLSHKLLDCERAFLKTLEGGCQLPCGIYSQVQGDQLILSGALFAIETREWVEGHFTSSLQDPWAAGSTLAKKILDDGGREILTKIRSSGGAF